MDSNQHPSWLDYPINFFKSWNIEKTLVVIIILLAIISRFYHVGDRVMSHDEVNHVVPSWELYQGLGYRHDPVTHGPFQFHVVALSYFLFGDNDITSRLPAATFSIAAVVFVLFAFRRYLGKVGAIVAGFLFLISPYMLFYGRYTRNEGFIELFGVLMLYALLRYLDRGDHFSLYLLTASTVLHFTSKETAFIYTAELLLFAGLLFARNILRREWPDYQARVRFLLTVGVGLLGLMAALGLGYWNSSIAKTANAGSLPAAPAVTPFSYQTAGQVFAILVTLAALIVAVIILIRNIGWVAIRSERSFDVLILIGSLILPQLAAFPVKLIGWDPLDYGATGLLHTSIFVLLFFAIAVLIGLWWNPKLWIGNAVLFYGIFTVLYTTFFTNGRGFFTGLVGSLGYWLAQQGVQRGSQPLYFYALVQIPVYEFLAALGTLVALYFGIRYWMLEAVPASTLLESLKKTHGSHEVQQFRLDIRDINTDDNPQVEHIVTYPSPDWDSGAGGYKDDIPQEPPNVTEDPKPEKIPTLALLLFWSFTSLVAFSFAGEKMPWLTVHIALPLLLTAGWGIGFLIETTPWKRIVNIKGLIALVLVPVFITSLAAVFKILLGDQPPFQGSELPQLENTSTFVFAFIAMILSAYGIWRMLVDWKSWEILRLMSVVFFGLLAVLTARAAMMASYINYDYATEFLVYAHAAPGPKQVLAQIEEISQRTTRGKDIVVAYDNDGLYPYWWYLRDYPNKKFFADKPTRDLRDAPLIISGEATMNKMEPIIKDNYIDTEYMRLWWPMQDYFNLTSERIWNAVKDPNIRAGIMDIWLNRDYQKYAQATGSTSLTKENWEPSSRMHFYVRKDIASQMWNYGTAPVAVTETKTDPYEKSIVPLVPEQLFGTTGTEAGQFQAPRGIAFAPDGSMYVADSRNNRIQHLTKDGGFINMWGTFADVSKGEAPGGTFYEPWGIAVGKDGSVYVADTWNHRVQKFTADGKFVNMWGYFGQAEKPEAFWGPRDIAIDSQGRVYITDTGNKRIVVFSPDGEYIGQFGQTGVEPGQFDEPVGIALSQNDVLYVADTWNQRMQTFQVDQEAKNFTPVKQWDVYGWFGQSLDNKPFVTVDANANALVIDPESPRILEFDSQGNFSRGWGDYTNPGENATIYTGIAVDAQGNIWVTDAANNHIIRFKAQ